MVNDDELLERLLEKIVQEVVPDLRESIGVTIEKEVARTLSRALLESEFHKRLNQEMRDGLQDIYKEIVQAAKHGSEQTAEGDGGRHQADQLFQEAAQQLDNILQTTESATSEIMDIVEKHMELQAECAAILDGLPGGYAGPKEVTRLKSANEALGEDLMRIMTTLSFQDLTGQRIKRIITAIKKVEQIVLDLYLSTGLQIRAQAQAPDRNIEDLKAEAKQKVSELKGPQSDVKQGDVDDLLAQLGLD
ncbi:MAG: chemotaxis protein [Solidesulfovibrio magneticus str. Maddingley MBC34]|uniref:Chemotaxis protein n=1 Tax=Solidesulfovibrio magneticus str. Maddingley MBC34 TaxID=1206767 RepID=K6GPD4_9BACT|nr:MAG: chemotaxis protein [Solidesulfovibrio magneticus str. Maddingley MBC34]